MKSWTQTKKLSWQKHNPNLLLPLKVVKKKMTMKETVAEEIPSMSSILLCVIHPELMFSCVLLWDEHP